MDPGGPVCGFGGRWETDMKEKVERWGVGRSEVA